MNKNERIIQIALELAELEHKEYVAVKEQLLEQVAGRPKLENIVEAVTAFVEGGR